VGEAPVDDDPPVELTDEERAATRPHAVSAEAAADYDAREFDSIVAFFDGEPPSDSELLGSLSDTVTATDLVLLESIDPAALPDPVPSWPTLLASTP
jgi:hypothetical protein